MQIKLNSLTLSNFKGIPAFTLKANGKNTIIRGINGAGKTRLEDAFLWLWFSKDSEGKSDFAIKSLKDGQEIPNLEHSVEGIFDIDGSALTLKKVFKEEYTKKRGKVQANLTGHTTDYFIDGVICGRKKDWDDKIQDIIDEETFRLLTDPTYFNSDKFGQNIKPVRPAWERRREFLFSLPENVPSDAEIITTISGLEEILNGKKPDDHRKIVKAAQTEINKRLTEIPSRIDELDKSLTDVSSYDVDAIGIEIKGLDDQIQAMKDDTVRSNLRKQKADLQAKLSELEVEKDRVSREATKEIDGKIATLETKLRIKKAYIVDLLSEIPRKENAIKYNETKMTQLREDYTDIAGKKADVEDTCPTCGQSLPKNQVHDAIKKENQRQASILADINCRGTVFKNENARLTEEMEAATKKGLKDEEDITNLEDQIKILKIAPLNLLFDTSRIDKIKAELQEIEKKLADNLPPDTSPLEAQRAKLQTKIAEVDAAKKSKARIEELGAEQKKLGAEYEELERQVSLLEKFTVAKVDMLEEKINSKFELARFKLFEKQINEGIKETCETLYHGKPYHGALSTGERILVGCDIISALQSHYNVHAPLWLDHGESVTSELDMDCQLISLVADKKFKELIVE